MRTPRPKLLALATAIGATLVLMFPTAGFAAYFGAETDYATSSAAPSGTFYCMSVIGATACFEPYGDVFYVKDTQADGYAAVAEWDTALSYRDGSCVNHLGNGKWGVCNKNFDEGEYLKLKAATYNNGNRIELSVAKCTGYANGRDWVCQ